MKFVLYAVLWSALLVMLPIIAIPSHTLLWQYWNWIDVIRYDQSVQYGLSVMGCLHTWFGISSGQGIVNAVAILLFLLPFSRWKLYSNHSYRLLIFCATLAWVVIFNHMAESPTYVIAVAGIGIWHFATPCYQRQQARIWCNLLLAAVFVFTCLSPTDLFPQSVIHKFFAPYSIKAIPCILAWCVIWIELMTMKDSNHESLITSAALVAGTKV